MDIRTLEYDLTIVDCGGFNRAAALYVCQPSLSQAVRALEHDLGSELFHRTGRRAVLTAMPSQAVEPLTTLIRGFSRRHPGVVVAVKAVW